VLSFPTSVVAHRAAVSSDILHLELDAMDEASLVSALEKITQRLGDVGAFIHVQQVEHDQNELFSESSKQSLLNTFLAAKHLKKMLASAGESGRAAFFTVSRIDGGFGYKSGITSAELVQGGLAGLTKSINQEWEHVYCRALDIAPELEPKMVADAIVAELYDSNPSHVEVAISKDGRAMLETLDIDSYQVEAGKGIDNNSVFLVSGGAKGVTYKCVQTLAERHKSKFILLGRSAFTGDDPKWAAGIYDETELKKQAMQQLIAAGDKPTPVKVNQYLRPVLSNREIASALTGIKKVGGQAIYVSVDVTDAAAVKKTVAKAVKTLDSSNKGAKKATAITGIIHGAGVLADKFIEQKSVADFNAVYDTKISGLAALFACVDVSKLKHLALFSSAAGFYGNAGQSDYSIANEILNKTALQFSLRHPKCRVLSFNWGPWDGGMVTPELKRMFAERNVYVIPLQAGSELFANQMNSTDTSAVQIMVGNAMQGEGRDPLGKKSLANRLSLVEGKSVNNVAAKTVISKVIRREANPFLEDHTIAGNPVLPTVFATGWMAKVCTDLYQAYGFKFCAYEEYRLYKGVVFDKTETIRLKMDVEELTGSATNILLKATIWSESGGRRVNHYSANVTLRQSVLPAPVYQYFDKKAQSNVIGTELYKNGTLFHGPLFQGVKELINISDQKLTLRCQVDPAEAHTEGQFALGITNPYVDDLLFQAMLVWARDQYGSASLPSMARRCEQYDVLPLGKGFFLSLDVKKHKSSELEADVTLHDASGRVYSRMQSGKVTISKSLNDAFVSSQ